MAPMTLLEKLTLAFVVLCALFVVVAILVILGVDLGWIR